MKKTILCMAGAALLAFSFTACNKAPQADDEVAGAGTGENNGLRIAFVEVDSIMTQYKFCIEYAAILEKKMANAESTLNRKSQTLQTAYNNFQTKLNNNEYTSREAAESAQQQILRQQQDLQDLQNRLGSELEAEKLKYNIALHDSLQNFIAAYNKDKGFDFILSKQGDNILFASPKYDVTDEVIAGLNKRYKSVEAKSEK